jgi:hypothetical protein
MEAKAALTAATDYIMVPNHDFSQYATRAQWNHNGKTHWDSKTNNKFHSIEPKTGSTYFAIILGRREVQSCTDCVLVTYITHAFIFQWEENVLFNLWLSINGWAHYSYMTLHDQHFQLSSLQELFETTNCRHSLEFFEGGVI